jgi:NitT/TauT family transport system substrate-binding protein
VATSYLRAHPANVTALLTGALHATEAVSTDTASTRAEVSSAYTALAGKTLKSALVTAAMSRLTFTMDPLAATVLTEAQHAAAVGLLTLPTSLAPLFDLAPLNAVLAAAGKPPVAGLPAS